MRITSECPPLVGATDGTASPTFCRDGRPNPPANAYFRPLGLATLESLGPSATFRSLLKALCGPVTKEGSFPIAGEDYALAAAKEGWPAAPGFDLTTVCRNPTAAEAENPPLLRVPPPPPARCDPGGNDLEMDSCIAEQLIAADRQLNTEMTMIFEASTTYDATGQGLHPTLPSLAPGESIAEAIRLDFIASQKAWLVYEQDDCSGEAQPNDGGTIQPQVVGDCLLQLDSHRLSDLRAYYQALLPG